MSLQRLRTETGPLHRDLENKLRLFETVATTDDYISHLKRLHHWLFHVESAMAPYADQLPVDWKSRCKAHLIKKDLEVLSETPIKREIDAAFSNCQNISAAWGILYVLEGSSLGGQIITRHYGKTLGLTPETGLSYFNGYGEKTGEMWTSFLKALTQYFAENPKCTDEIISSACSTFRSYSEFVPQPQKG